MPEKSRTLSAGTSGIPFGAPLGAMHNPEMQCSEAPLPTMALDRHRPLTGAFKHAMLKLAEERGKTLAEILGPYFRSDDEAGKV